MDEDRGRRREGLRRAMEDVYAGTSAGGADAAEEAVSSAMEAYGADYYEAVSVLFCYGMHPPDAPVWLVGHEGGEGTTILGVSAPEDGCQELPVYTLRSTAEDAIRELSSNETLERMGVAEEDLCAVPVGMKRAGEIARSQGCSYLGLEFGKLCPAERRLSLEGAPEDAARGAREGGARATGESQPVGEALSERQREIYAEIRAASSAGEDFTAVLERLREGYGCDQGEALALMFCDEVRPPGTRVWLTGFETEAEGFCALALTEPSDGAHEVAVFVGAESAEQALDEAYPDPDIASRGLAREDLVLVQTTFEEALDYARRRGYGYIGLEPGLIDSPKRRIAL